jgi:hypothetical protein
MTFLELMNFNNIINICKYGGQTEVSFQFATVKLLFLIFVYGIAKVFKG